MNTKIILITGATGGIGKAAALALARQGHTLILHGRDERKTKAVAEEIKTASKNPNIDFLVADLFLLSEVRRMTKAFLEKYDRLDVLLNNAGGVMNKTREETAEGLEKTMALNLYAPFLLSQLLLEALKKSPEGRIVNVSSNSHHLNAKPDFSDLSLKQHYHPLRAYGNAKLFLIWITQKMAAELPKDGVRTITVNTLHPGAVATNFGVNSNLGPLLNGLARLMRPFFLTEEQGADTLVYLASAKEVANISGQYFVKRKPAKVSLSYYTKEHEQRVWEECERVTEMKFNP